MAENAISIVSQAVSSAAQVWETLVDRLGMWRYYFAAILGLLLLRYIFAPIFGRQLAFGGSSDMAQGKFGDHLRSQLKEDSDG